MQFRLRQCQSTITHWWRLCIRESPLYILGVILQPHLRTKLFDQWKTVWGIETIDQAQQRARDFWKAYQQAITVGTPQPSQRHENLRTTSASQISILTTKFEAMMLHPPRPQDEMEDYLSVNLDFEVQKMEREGFRISYILEWWYLQRHRWPTTLAICN